MLLIVGLISALAIAATGAVRTHRTDAALERELVQAGALADAGLNRLVAALEGTDDPLRASLLEGRGPIHWSFAGHPIAITLVLETGKVDLNSGDPELVTNVLRAVVRDRTKADRLLARLNRMRLASQDLETVRGLLDPGDQIGPLARDLEAAFTVWTGLRGVDPRSVDPIVLRNLPGLQEGEAAILEQARARRAYADLSPFIARFGPLLAASRPIYRARAEATLRSGATGRREALLAYNPTTRAVLVVFWRDILD